MAEKSVTELVEAARLLQSLQPQSPPVAPKEEKDVTKLVVGGVCTLVGAIILALFLWVGASVSNLSSVVTRMSANMDTLQKTVNDIQSAQSSTGQQLADGKATDARQDARADAAEADMNRVKERVRILEGQKPLQLTRNQAD